VAGLGLLPHVQNARVELTRGILLLCMQMGDFCLQSVQLRSRGGI